jgi:formylglycine-generating enzyme required for sulfatase activity
MVVSYRFCTIGLVLGMVALGLSPVAMADGFGTGANQFEIDFVTISGDSGDLGSWPAGSGYTFTGVNRSDYRMGTFEITNDQYAKFKSELGVPVTGDPSSAYDRAPYWTGANVPSNEVSWYEAAQFVNWLNTSTGHQAAYRFTGTQGMGDYALATWSTAEADGTNLYRHRDAFYFLPTEDEWVKAAYWNGSDLQTYATQPGETLHQGDGTSGTGWNFYDNDYATDPHGPWDVGSGSEELNGTFDMMGNLQEWMESPYSDTNYGPGSDRGRRGGGHFSYYDDLYLASSNRRDYNPNNESSYVGFRVASEVPEPATMSLLALGGVTLLRRRSGL